ncbi:MAG: hypothetical protein ACI8P3_003467 [Saprospiraceae bacterium]|jgi:hypothetical protein
MIDSLVKVYDDIFKKERAQDLAQLAREEQFSFIRRVSFSTQLTELKGFKVFSSKGAKRFLGVLFQQLITVKGRVRFYDYLNTKDLETRSQSIVEIYTEDLFANYLMIEPKSTFSKMKGFFVAAEAQFPQLEVFNHNFQISSKIPEANLLLRESALKLMSDYPGLTFEALGNHFLFYYRKKELKTPEIIPLINFAEEFLRLLCFDDRDDYV